ncbi:hypothetical protein JF550_13225 [Microbacterium esteraromaticum]|uniref:Uncharacterized protein n=1 Tax=Microbacterium esteraromaticum TaxID=57043 RepID=A0A939DXW3_9MICO|nr:hypothetical protein [Microbacterium esteraromaticum]MBN7794828.1 hypothetical protein [Microbacterium esteraromaticum]MBN8206911.1 hypothetical protein [Microbacterium esteraromaticum]MBN8417066.1 hypothetical protein [Microbacterium esteraromaticum]MCA1307451.1 hypothetical protein [Microbacterium esteraromaticum]
MPAPHGFEHIVRGDDVVILHHGIRAATLRGAKAADFLDRVETEDPQLLMARLTGNYRRGNERTARQHPRNKR